MVDAEDDELVFTGKKGEIPAPRTRETMERPRARESWTVPATPRGVAPAQDVSQEG